MTERREGVPPTWLFASLTAGSLVVSGIYIGKTMVIGASGPDVLRAILFGALGILWFIVCRSRWSTGGAPSPGSAKGGAV